jgi:hypothetical protein
VRLDAGSQEARLDEEATRQVQTKRVSTYGKPCPHRILHDAMATERENSRDLFSLTLSDFLGLSLKKVAMGHLLYPIAGRNSPMRGLGC